MTQRGQLGPDDVARLMAAKQQDEEAAKRREVYKRVAVAMVEKSSYREVERLTGLSTNTLQRWKREAK